MENMQEIISAALARGEVNCPEGVPAATWEMYKASYLATIQQNAQAATVTTTAPAPVIAIVPQNNLGNTSVSVAGAYTPPAANFDLDNVAPSGFSGVNGYLKPQYGQTLVDSTVISEDVIYATIDMANVAKKLSIKGGNPVQYASTYDGMSTPDGSSWIEAQKHIQILDKGARPYTSYDIPLTLLTDLTSVKVSGTEVTRTVVAHKGDVYGHTTPTTGRKNFEKILLEIQRQGRTVKDAVVNVKVTRSDLMKEKNKWAVFSFDLLTAEEEKQLGLITA